MNVPSLAQLQALQGRPVRLLAADGEATAAVVARVESGMPMDEHFECYSAELLLEPGRQLPQAIYRLCSGHERWPLLMTPVGFGAERRGRLQAVVHRPTGKAT